MHAETGGLDIMVETDGEAAEMARRLLTLFQGDLPNGKAADQRELRHLVPEDRKRAYVMREVIETLVDQNSFIELGAAHAPGLITGLCRVQGRSIALIANNPMHLGGALDAPASAKGARFLRLCGRFSLPVLSLCDTPGFMVGPDSEEQGAVAAACDFIAAGADLKTPLFLVCLRKGYGIGAQAMAGGSFATPAFTLAWPSGEFGAMGLEGAVRLGRRRELEAESDPAEREALFERYVAHAYREGGALNMASLFEIDAVIDPQDTRSWILRGLDMSRSV
jgi:acetyl-CoA carboxylase carboxyltransferase component